VSYWKTNLFYRSLQLSDRVESSDSPRVIRVITIPLQGQSPGELAFSPDGTLLGLTGVGVSLRVYDALTGKLLWSMPSLPNDYRDGATSFSPDNRYVIRTWIPSEIFEAKTGKKIESLPYEQRPGNEEWPCLFLEPGVYQRLMSPDGKWSTGGTSTELHNRTKYEWIDFYPILAYREGSKTEVPLWRIAPLVFSPDSALLVFGDGPKLHIIRVEELARLNTLDRRSSTLPVVPIVTTLKLPRKHFQDAAFTLDGKRLLTVSNEATVRVWETVNWSECHAYEWKAGPLKAIAMSSDGTRAAVAGTRKIVIWDLDD
jgi:WD40 repeat protein